MEFYVDVQTLHDTNMTVIKDEKNQPVYILTGRRGIANDGFFLHTISGNELGEIRQRTVSVNPRFDLLIGGEKVASIKKMFGVWREFIFVSELNWMVIGNMLANQYHIYHGMKTVTTIASVGTASETILKLDIANPRDVVPGLLVAALLDRWRQANLANPLVRHDVGISYGL
ncbi:LURP-one-related/scramblase family protein [Lacticaseibacillus yichunensis]|uniref:LURP-one-related/scramblase family protein n=1 Tax=Lacticaseibacillus yichunensis TaxID=2486015 RepID=A0ABW4CMT3_9LACO|nr:hypothetical protein [Lacticaseibacillus yichunensis]